MSFLLLYVLSLILAFNLGMRIGILICERGD